jgi:hypothetical protein
LFDRGSDFFVPDKLPTPFASPMAITTIPVNSAIVWNNTDVKINAGQPLKIIATGQVNFGSPGDGADKWVDADGWGNLPSFLCNGKPCQYKYALNDSAGSLIGKIGNGQPFHVGSHFATTSSESGILYLGVNDAISDWTGKLLPESEVTSQIFSNNRGSFTVQIQVPQ